MDEPSRIIACKRCGVRAGLRVDHGELVVVLGYPQFMADCQCDPAIGKECPELQKAVSAATAPTPAEAAE